MSVLRGLSGSILTRIATILAALGATALAATVIGWMVFQTIATGLAEFTEDRLPQLESSAAVSLAAAELRGRLIDLLALQTRAELAALGPALEATLAQARARIAALSPERRAALDAALRAAGQGLAELAAARAAEFDSHAAIATAVEHAAALEAEVDAALAAASARARDEMLAEGGAVIAELDSGLGRILDTDVALLGTALRARAELNLLGGLALAAAGTNDPVLRAALAAPARAADAALAALVPRLAEAPATAAAAGPLGAARAGLARAFTAEGRVGPPDPSRLPAPSPLPAPASLPAPARLLDLRAEADAALSAALGDLGTDLATRGAGTRALGRGTLSRLLEGQALRLRDIAALDAAAKHVFAAALQVALAPDAATLGRRAQSLAAAAAALGDRVAGEDPALVAQVAEMLALADPASGVAASRRAALAAADKAALEGRQATVAVLEITRRIGEDSARSRAAIAATSAEIGAMVGAARARMGLLGAGALALLAVAPLLAWAMIVRPLNRTIRVTERLAQGELSPVTGLPAHGELGRLAAALRVFRENALERQRLQAEERARELAERARLASEAEETRRREAAERARDRAQAEEAAARDRAEAARTEAGRREAEERRAAEAEVQAQVVSALALGLGHLSRGDLTHRIDRAFPAAYDQLRRDFNQAIETLGGVIGGLAASATVIGSSSIGISQTSAELSRRTEAEAATLEQTAAALDQLTAAVSSSAEGARQANLRVASARQSAETSRTIMTDAMSAMGSIESSSMQIGRITSVLDDIAFQTNLLALNAGVEAARAGEAGRGFAVVASEVRALALRAAEAAAEINRLIADSRGHVQNGVTSVRQVGSALETIVTAVTEISDHVARISATAAEQSAGIGEINTSVGELDAAAQRNVAMFEETAAACGMLVQEAGQLSQAVNRFAVPKGPATSPGPAPPRRAA
ncbi:methyl-accepting chemotaxis protein [Frigidibacter sp. MR17.24]|uniref:methyl-accepting chemotaxis protein n=1 Tax=Frigidibacter sp. MR17.24 TaxID=3127345 RepID=UPI003012E8F4